VNAGDQSVEDGQDQFDWMIITGTLREKDLFLQIPFQSQFFCKTDVQGRCPQSESDCVPQGRDVKFLDLLASGTKFLFKDGSAEAIFLVSSMVSIAIIRLSAIFGLKKISFLRFFQVVYTRKSTMSHQALSVPHTLWAIVS